jgi:hypothetical protein
VKQFDNREKGEVRKEGKEEVAFLPPFASPPHSLFNHAVDPNRYVISFTCFRLSS